MGVHQVMVRGAEVQPQAKALALLPERTAVDLMSSGGECHTDITALIALHQAGSISITVQLYAIFILQLCHSLSICASMMRICSL